MRGSHCLAQSLHCSGAVRGRSRSEVDIGRRRPLTSGCIPTALSQFSSCQPVP